MTTIILKAICEAITLGILTEDSPLSLMEFQAIHEACSQRDAWLNREHANAVRRALAKMQRDALEEVSV